MAERSALVVWGGWDGHQPEAMAGLFREILEAEGFAVTVSDTLDAFADRDLTAYSLIVPTWTMGTITPEQRGPVITAVAEHGVGMAGCHGGMCDAFRNDTEWQFLTGGQWVAHPGDDGVEYTVNIRRDIDHPITTGIDDIPVKSEQYYLHTDPGNLVLATTEFPNAKVPGPHSGNPSQLPQIWVRTFGKGRVFYSALGHRPSDVASGGARETLRRGFLWAAKGVGLG